MTTKLCRKCNITKNISCFSKHSCTADKLDNRCKECVAKVKKERKENSENILEYPIYDINLNSKDWQVGKPSGSILHRIDSKSGAERYEVRITVDGKLKSKSFAFKSYQTKDEAYKEAEKWKNDFSSTNGLTRNRIRVINKKYIEIELTAGCIMKTDIQFSDLCQKYTIVSTKGGHSNSEYYAAICVGNTNHNFHNYITGFKMVDHMNRNPMDNRLDNLRDTNHKINNNNQRARTTDTGVRLVQDRLGGAWQARIKQDNKEYSKSFSIREYGYEEAKILAKKYRSKLNRKFGCNNGQTLIFIDEPIYYHTPYMVCETEKDETQRCNKISSKLVEFNQTSVGKELKKEAHKKRSETMEKQREELRANLQEKKCSKCNITMSIKEFNSKKDAKDGLQPYCRTCINTRKQELRKLGRKY